MANFVLPKLNFTDPKLQALYNSIGSGGAAAPTNSFLPAVTTTPGQASELAGLQTEATKIGELLKFNTGDKKVNEELAKINAKIVQYGGKPYVPQHHKGVFDRFVDVIQRPENAVVGALTKFGTSATAATPEGVNHPTLGGLKAGFKALPSGFWGGLSGKDKATGASMIQKAADADLAHKKGLDPKTVAYGTAKVNPIAKGLGGFGLDLALDPLSYTGFGVTTKVPGATEKGLSVSRSVVKDVAPYLSKKESEALAGATGLGKSKASQSKIFNDLQPLIAKLGATEHKTAMKELAGQELSKSEIAGAAESRSVALQQKIMDNYLKGVSLPVDKQLSLRVGTFKQREMLGKPTRSNFRLPGSQALVKALNSPTKIDPVARGVETFQKHMKVSHNIAPEIHQAGSAVFGQETGRMRAYGLLLDQNLKGLKKADREMVLKDVLAGATGEGDHALAAPTQFVAKQITNLRHAVEGNFGEEGALTHKEMSKWLYGSDKFLAPTKANPDWFIRSIANMKEKDAGRLLWRLHSTYVRALTFKGLKQSFADSFGVPLAKELGPTARNLSEKHGWKQSKHIGDTHLFDPEVADGIDRMLSQIANHSQIGQFGRTVRAMTQPIKTALTKYSPGYHSRNAITDAFINALHGVQIPTYKKATHIMVARRHTWEQAAEDGTDPLFLQEGDPLANALALKDKVTAGGTRNTQRLIGADGKVRPQITSSEYYAGAHKYGIFQTFAAHEFPEHLKDKTGVMKGLQDISNKVSKWSDNRESIMRLAHFMQLVQDNPGKYRTVDEVMAHAGAEVRKWHVDYSDFTKFERNVMSNVFPFYKWTRKNIPLMTEALFTHPGQVVALPKMERALSEVAGYDTENSIFPAGLDKVVPGWMRDSGFVPIAKADGNGGFYIALPNPFTDLVNQTLAPVGDSPTGFKQTFGGSLNPLFKIPLEEYKGQQFFGDIPIKNQQDYFLNQLPATHVANNAITKGNYGSLASFLTGIYTQQNTPARQQGELMNQQFAAEDALKKARESYRKKHHLKKGERIKLGR